MGNVGRRLGAFALILGGTFGTSYALGEKLPGHSHDGSTSHSHWGEMTTPVIPTTESSGYSLVNNSISDDNATFRLVDPDGILVTSFAVVHGSGIHAFVTPPDLSTLEHTHPSLSADGTWQVPLPGPGRWHVVIEATPTNASRTVTVSTDIDNGSTPPTTGVATGPAIGFDTDTTTTAQVGDLTVTREGLMFVVTKPDGSIVVDFEPYLGAGAHLVVLRVDDLAYVHLHDTGEMQGMVMFNGDIPTGSVYRLFLQFATEGQPYKVAFTVPASEVLE